MVTAPAPAALTSARADLRSLHAALAQAIDVRRILQVCHEATADCGARLWVAACLRPRACTYLGGSARVRREDVAATLQDMQAAADASRLAPSSCFSIAPQSWWQNPGAEPQALCPDRFAQVELVGNRTFYGLLRVVMDGVENAGGCDWEAVGNVMCAAAPHIVLCLQQQTVRSREEAATGLCPVERFMARVQGEVDRGQSYGAEFSLVVLDIQTAPDRGPGDLTPTEVEAVARVLLSSLRTSDLACRLPDGRFGLLLPLTHQRNALIACARVSDALRKCPELPPTTECRAGVSGWCYEGPQADELFEQASQAVEDARQAGVSGAFIGL